MPIKVTYIGNPMLRPVIEGRVSVGNLARRNFRPNKKLMSVIGDQLIEGFMGGDRMIAPVINQNGNISASYGRYSRGIFRGKSPDGTPYEPLKEVTIALKKRTDRPDGKPRSRYPDRPLIDTALMVKGLRKSVSSDGLGVRIFFADPETDRISQINEEGRSGAISTSLASKGGAMRRVEIPARPHRDIQPEAATVVRSLLRQWSDRWKK